MVPCRLVAAAPRDDVDRSGVGHAGREVEIHRRYLEFLEPFLREPHLRAAERHRGDAASIHGEARTADVGGGRAEHREDRAIAIGSGWLLHTGLELAELEEAAPVQWQPLDLIAADRTADGGRIEPELRRRRLDSHRLGHIAHTHHEVRRGRAAGFYSHGSNDPLETCCLDGDVVFAG